MDDTTVANENENGLSNQNGEKEDVTDVAAAADTHAEGHEEKVVEDPKQQEDKEKATVKQIKLAAFFGQSVLSAAAKETASVKASEAEKQKAAEADANQDIAENRKKNEKSSSAAAAKEKKDKAEKKHKKDKKDNKEKKEKRKKRRKIRSRRRKARMMRRMRRRKANRRKIRRWMILRKRRHLQRDNARAVHSKMMMAWTPMNVVAEANALQLERQRRSRSPKQHRRVPHHRRVPRRR